MCSGIHPYIPVPNTIQVVAVQSIQGEIAENVFHFMRSSAWTSADIQTVVNAVVGLYANKISGLTTAAWSLTEVRAADLTTQDGLSFDRGVTNVSGSGAGVAMPNNVAAVISWGTAQRGRSFRGRSYFSGLASSHIVNTNQIDSGAVSALNDFGNSMRDTASMAGAQLAVVSYCHNKTWRTEGVATPIISQTSEVKLRTQRRRMPR
jgi:hypothetical protein